MENLRKKENIFYVLVFLLIGLVYFLHAPQTVQTGDSGELSAAAYKLLVAHPPGYPLWIWLNHAWLSIASFGSTYFTLVVFGILLSLCTLFFLGKNIPSVPAKIITLLGLGLSYLYWKHSMIPEVFILNLFFACTVIYTGNLEGVFPKTNIPLTSVLMPLLYSLSMANHQTTIFLLPYVIWVCWKYRKFASLYISIAAGVLICTLLYISMLKMNPDYIYSWGHLKNLTDVWNHFLRKDYGTFALHPTPNKGSFNLLIQYFFEHLMLTASPVILFSCWIVTGKVIKKDIKSLVWPPFNSAIAACLAVYVMIFLPMMQMAPLVSREEMSERFFLLPITLVMMLLGKFIAENFSFNSKNKVIVPLGLACIVSYLSLVTFSSDNDYSNNTIVSDYTKNYLNIAAEFKNPVIFCSMDTEHFGLRYTQIVERVQPHVLVVGSFDKLNDEKARRQFPELNFHFDLPKDGLGVSLADDIIAPNEKNSTFISDQDEFSPKFVKVTYLPLGALISSGKGVDFRKTSHVPEFLSDASIIKKPYEKFDLFRNILVKYTYFFAVQGITEAAKGNYTAALDNFERVLMIAPFEKHALANICEIKKNQKVEDPKCNHLEASKEWFDYYDFNKAR